MVDVYSQDWLIPRYGMYALDYANVWPDLTEQMRKLYRDKVSQLPFLPGDWWASVNALHGRDGKFLMIAPSGATGGGQTAKFLDTDDKRQVWDDLANQLNAVRMAFVNQKREEGQRLVQQAYDNVAFWDNAYSLASVLASPVQALKTAWNNPWLVGVVVYGGLGLLVWRALSKRYRG